jgi:AcrR family transcriptional regulator
MELSKRQQEIIDVSIALIADQGIQHLTIKNISREIGISEPAIYRHFESKFDILMAILDSFEMIASDVLGTAATEKLPALDKIELFLFDRYRRCSDNPKLAKVMFSEENFQDDQRLADKVLMIMHRHKNRIDDIISGGVADGEIRSDIDAATLFRIIFGPMRLLVKQWCLTGYRFNLIEEGRKLWEAEKLLLRRTDK